jgi:antitoxin component of MazEF toxin-antitoxin module
MAAKRTRIRKIGSGLGVRLPGGVLEQFQLREGDQVTIDVNDRDILVRKTRPALTLDELVNSIDPDDPHPETDWGQPVGREEW